MTGDLFCQMCQHEPFDIEVERLADGGRMVKCAKCGAVVRVEPPEDGSLPTVH